MMKKQNSGDTTASFLEEFPKMGENSGTAPAYTVVKRNGTLVPFHRERILKAIDAAFRDTKKCEVLDAEQEASVQRITDTVVKQVLHLASKGACLTVEGIQDVVEVTLMKHGYHDVARDYIIYRDNRKHQRAGSVQNLKIYRRDKTTPTRFNPMKIASSIERAFRRARNIHAQTTAEIIEAVNIVTQNIVRHILELASKETILYIDIVEDQIEWELMNGSFFDVAKHFILYRAEKVKKQVPLPIKEDPKGRSFEIATADNEKMIVTERMLRNKLTFASRGLETLTSIDELLEIAISQYYVGMKDQEVDLAHIFAAKSLIEKEPAYSQVASRLLLDVIYREAFGVPASDPSLRKAHKQYFQKYIKAAISYERVSPLLLDFDLDELGSAMDLNRDDLFSYLGLQTLYDRYFIHHEQRRLETPQIFWMRVAMGLSLNEGKDKNKWAIEFYHVLSQFHFTSSTPTLFNSGTLHSQLSSCYLSTVMDDLQHIFKVIADDAQLSKWAGGIGNDWTNVRATGARIKGTNGTSQGVIPFLKVANDTAVAVNQCFAPDTHVYTATGPKMISEIKTGDLVLGVSGTYREVVEKYTYNQKDPMISLTVEHSLGPIAVTAGHPFYAIQGVPTEQSNGKTLEWLKRGKLHSAWIDASELKPGDCVAQVIPQEILPVAGLTEDDAYLYGILLSDGHLTKDGFEWGVSGNSKNALHLDFVRRYLAERRIHFWETSTGDSCLQIRWASGYSAV